MRDLGCPGDLEPTYFRRCIYTILAKQIFKNVSNEVNATENDKIACGGCSVHHILYLLDDTTRTGLYRAKGQNRPFFVLEPYTPRTCYLLHNSKYRRDSAVAYANSVLVKLICDGLGPG